MMCKERMNCIQNWLKKHLLVLIAATDLLFLTTVLFSYFNDVNHLSIYDLTSEQILVQDIDSNMGEGMIYITDEFPVEKGYYVYSIEYDGNAAGSWIYPYAYVDYYDKAEMKEFYFEEGASGRRVEFWINADLRIRFYMQHHDEGTVHINAIHLEETPMQARKNLFWNMLLLGSIHLLLCIHYYHKKHPIVVSSKYVFAGLAATALVASYPLFAGYAFNGHDFNFHLVRIEGIKDGLLAGQFPVRINPDFFYGYGYANSIMYGELLLYFPALLRFVGVSLTDAFLAYCVFVNILTTFGSYWCFSRILRDKMTGVIAAFLYVMAPYRIMDVYLRTAVGEYSAMIFLPFLAYGLYRIYVDDAEEQRFRYSFVPLTIGLTGIIQTHVLTGEMTAIFIVLTCLVMIKRTFCRKRFWELAKSVMVTLLLNAWFIVPFLDYYLTQDIKVAKVEFDSMIRATGANLTQIMALFQQYAWKNLEAGEAIGSEMSQTLGLALVLGMILCAAMLWTVKRAECSEKKRACFFFLMGILATWMATVYFPWDSLTDRLGILGKMLLAVQYTWRYLGIAILFCSIATGFALLMLRGKEEKHVFAVAATVVCMLTAISSIYYMQECINYWSPVRMNGLEGMNTQHAAMEEEYILCKKNYDVVAEIHEPRIYGDVVIDNYEKQGTNVSFYAESDALGGYVLLPLQAYKGYQLKSSDGSLGREHLTEGPDAVVQVNIPEGFSGDIEVRFAGFWYWRLAEAVSVGTLAALLFYGWRTGHRREPQSGEKSDL